ncbi:related to mRNA splicing-associated serine-threonine protein kinase [Pseudozyma flocculosa]|uniref:non-specific serine/threonine protein kinase n=1 Tax=Pseudozyma flocculosa TaxID=84751 RepID=A0A5C3EUF0_9BASI|nr:related to mRNA splicing-associated serine-threonine protein kinase [Pseudozyma flocculosa]
MPRWRRISSSAAAEQEGRGDVKDDAPDDVDYDLDDDQKAEKLLEESRKRRQAILQKYSATASPISSAGAPSPAQPASVTVPQESRTEAAQSTNTSTPRMSGFSLAKDDAAIAADARGADGISAADYNPDLDKAEDEAKQQQRLRRNLGLPLGPVGGKGTAAPDTVGGVAEGLGEPVDKLEDEYEEIEVDDDDDVDDMFALDEDRPKKKKVIRVPKGGSAAVAPMLQSDAGTSAATLNDNWDDPDGYYRIILGETMDRGRYQVFANLGKGMFSSVVKARDLQNGDREVAIKIVRIQETMYKAGLKEIGILKKLAELDPEDKKHVIRLEGHFEHRGHLCMVFESLSMNLREVVKRFGKDVGLNLMAVKSYAHQMFAALCLLRKANLMHADIKPDNILVNDAKNLLKVCDLGSASDLSEMEITPYLVSRFYRAPEIILGQPYDCAIDVWSIGCTLYELATGKILFPGRSNNQMLLLMQELRGKFTTKQIRRGQFGEQHFDDTNAFLSLERDKSTGQKPTEDLRARLLPGNAAKRLREGELRLNNHFIDLLNRCLELDPSKRITPKEALAHPFLTSP